MNDPQESTIDEILAAFLQSRDAGETVVTEDLLAQYPEFAEELRQFFSQNDHLYHLIDPVEAERPTEQDQPAIREFGDYQLLEQIAQGGMGIVYKARQKSLNRIIALKVIRSSGSASKADIKRFQTEAESAAKLKHPHIVTVYEVGEHEGQPYFTMPYVSGCNLASIVADHPLSPELAVKYALAMAEAIEYAHREGILHRDLKPSNILIDGNDRVQVTDFGLATQVGNDSELTRTGQIIGTPSYMSPEQASGQRELVSPRSDIYSLGATLYELLTGRPPFRAATVVETIRQVIDVDPPSPRLLNPTLPRDLETICLKCLEKAPARRYQSANELADELGRFQRGEPIYARQVSRAEHAWRWCRRRPLVSSLMALSLLLLFIVAIGGPILTFRLSTALTQSENDRQQAVVDRNTALEAEQDSRRAEKTAKQHQLDALISEARASRYSGRVGQRFGTLKAVQNGVALAKELGVSQTTFDTLRNLAISGLVLPDVKPSKLWVRHENPLGSLEAMSIDPSFQFVAEPTPAGEILIRKLSNQPGVSSIFSRIPSWEKPGQNLHWGPKGRYLVRSDRSSSWLELWEIHKGESQRLLLEKQPRYSVGFSSDQKFFLSFGNGQLDVYELPAVKRLRSIKVAGRSAHSKISVIGMHPRKPQAAIVTLGGVNLVNYLTGKTEQRLVSPTNVRNFAKSAVWHPHGELLAIGYETSVELWNLSLGKKSTLFDTWEQV